MSDSFRFDLHCTPIGPSLDIAFHSNKKATHYRKDPDQLVLAWTDPKDEEYKEFPLPLTREEAENFIKRWLTEEAEYGPEEDTDGHCSKSWYIYNEAWGHVDDKWQCFVAIEPEWAVYGK
jgi:hypothetical protein